MEIKFPDKEYNDNKIIFLKKIIDDSYAFDYVNNTFCAFNSINNIFYLIYSNQDCSIIFYDLEANKIISEFKNAHEEYITSFRHFLDKKNKRDVILSISNDNGNIKLWDVNNLELIFNFKDVYSERKICSACFIFDNNENYILTSNCDYSDEHEPIKVFNFNGEKVKEIKDSNDSTNFIDVYYDNKSSKNYIISLNSENVKSFDYNENKLYYQYKENYNDNDSKGSDLDEDENTKHVSGFIYEKDNIIKLIEIDEITNLRIWDFHTGELLDKIRITLDKTFDILLLNDRYVAVSCINIGIILYDFKENIITISEKYSKEKCVLTIKKVFIKQYGECIISQESEREGIKLWKINC